MRKPDFFVVGQVKAGTTSIYHYLYPHPEVFLPEAKEPGWFGADTSYPRFASEAEYLALFAGARDQKRVGDTTPWYLFSESAAREIRAFNPEARIVVMLRNPVDTLYAIHSQARFSEDEPLDDFEAALEAEADRKSGRRVPPSRRPIKTFFYRDLARYAEQLERYVETFGRARVHLILFEDLGRDVAGEYEKLCRFLEIDPSFVPSFEVHNPNKRVRSRAAQRLLLNPPPAIRALGRRLIRAAPVRRAWQWAWSRNVTVAKRAPLDPAIRARLTRELAPEVEKLARLIGRDLSAWL